jgi:hypothetical protein
VLKSEINLTIHLTLGGNSSFWAWFSKKWCDYKSDDYQSALKISANLIFYLRMEK